MKKIELLFSLLFAFTYCYAQQFNYFEGHSNLSLTIDTSQEMNIWQIGIPQKEQFNESYSEPNVIITDTIDNYPASNISSFEVVVRPESLWSYPMVIFMFWHKMDVDISHAGGWIDASYDGGATWSNAIKNPSYPLAILDYNPSDTLFNGEVGFGSNSTYWNLSTLCWGVGYGLGLPTPDSIMLRFNFASDEEGESREGWMIDNMEVYPEVIHVVEELRQMANQESLVTYPNPVDQVIHYLFRIEKNSGCIMRLLDTKGSVLYQKNMGVLAKGIYVDDLDISGITNSPNLFFMSIELEGRRHVRKIIKR